jgi:hypothetical protein
MVFNRLTKYRHKATKCISIFIKDSQATPEVFAQYEEIKEVVTEPIEKDTSYNVKRMIEKNTGVQSE